LGRRRIVVKRYGDRAHVYRDCGRIAVNAKRNQTGCFFEINSSPERLDLSAENARLAHQAGVMIAVSTDAHSIREFGSVRYGIDQARHAGAGYEIRPELSAMERALSPVAAMKK
jgi:histidinol phosphatase-like PHP family hydrolase